MKSTGSKRKLSSVKLTGAFHFRYLGLWVFLSLFLVLFFNVALYMLLEAQWGQISTLGASSLREYILMRKAFGVALVTEMLFFAAAIIALSVTTTHRIAGPFVRLRAAFEDVAGGNLNHRLRFRKYDELGEVAKSFNRMMDTVREQSDEKSHSQKDPTPPKA